MEKNTKKKKLKGVNKMKNKIYKFIGQAVTYIIIYLAVEATLMQASLYIINNCLTTIR